MDDKQALAILRKLLDKYPLDADEKEAVAKAIGMLSWSALGRSTLAARKAKRDKSKEW